MVRTAANTSGKRLALPLASFRTHRMPKDSLSEALFELKDRERKKSKAAPRPAPPRPQRGRPKAFDAFYLFAQILLGMSVIAQLVVVALFA